MTKFFFFQKNNHRKDTKDLNLLVKDSRNLYWFYEVETS